MCVCSRTATSTKPAFGSRLTASFNCWRSNKFPLTVGSVISPNSIEKNNSNFWPGGSGIFAPNRIAGSIRLKNRKASPTGPCILFTSKLIWTQKTSPSSMSWLSINMPWLAKETKNFISGRSVRCFCTQVFAPPLSVIWPMVSPRVSVKSVSHTNPKAPLPFILPASSILGLKPPIFKVQSSTASIDVSSPLKFLKSSAARVPNRWISSTLSIIFGSVQS
mmetsp:Transcript_10592/g.20069  ORF Transcript_10592/g.20069 Transcript_10592/m.20069 type:complete len:220 (+) Transcript_10592:1691-2350(+)